ncbi:MAG: type IV secretory system conjugative DNA transfer family protein, partial [Gammaproteobacteria bacterium]|nr:type IV secretory system conjugative DNA transfer family protein [Gammaproteobacteria bacterium]
MVGIIVSGTIAGRYVWRYVYHGRQPFGNARFATGWDLYQSGMLAKRGFILGSSHYGPLRFAGYEPIIFIAGTGGGKTKAIVIPNMLELYQESLVVTDIKGEIYAATHEYRKAIGQAVYRFEPAASDTHCYNPLGLLRLDHLDEDLDTVFHTLIPDSRESLWADASRNIAKMLAMYTILEKKETPTLQSIYQMVCAPEFLDDITLTHQEIKNPRVKNLFGKFMMAKEETRRDFLLSAQEY